MALSYNQILGLVRQLPKSEKAKLGAELAKESIDTRLTKLLSSFRTDELSQEIINSEIESVRSEIYAKKKKS